MQFKLSSKQKIIGFMHVQNIHKNIWLAFDKCEEGYITVSVPYIWIYI